MRTYTVKVFRNGKVGDRFEIKETGRPFELGVSIDDSFEEDTDCLNKLISVSKGMELRYFWPS